MILISHRGNINGRIESSENEPTYIDLAISKGYNIEIDVWFINNMLFLGHDKPLYNIQIKWILARNKKLWIHCKNLEAINYFRKYDGLNYFWHENDTITLTSLNYIWAFPGKQPIENSIAVMPEIYNDNISRCVGVCSDFIKKYKSKKVTN